MYKFRNLPCTIKPEDKIWCISGTYENRETKEKQFGVLEWCYDEEDANQLLEYMLNYDGFNDLYACKFIKEEKDVTNDEVILLLKQAVSFCNGYELFLKEEYKTYKWWNLFASVVNLTKQINSNRRAISLIKLGLLHSKISVDLVKEHVSDLKNHVN